MKRRIRLGYGALLLIILFLTGKSFLKENIDFQEDVLEEFQEGREEQRKIGREFELERGLYQVSVTYETDSTNHYITAASENKHENVGCDRILLERAKSQEIFQVWVSDRVDDFQILGEYVGTGGLSISQIAIHQRTLGKVHDLFCGFIFCGLLVLILEAALRGWFKRREHLIVLAGLSVIVILISMPLLARGIYDGHDSGFHLNRIEGVWQGLASGQLPVRIQPNWLHNYGYAVSVCYGDILLYIPAFLRLVGFSVQEAYEWFVFLVNIATAGISYYCWKKMFMSQKIALFTTFLYAFSVYRLTNVYTRAAVGEYCAMIFFPFVVYGFWCILNKTCEKENRNWWPLMVGFTGLIQTHMLSCEIVGIFSVFLCLIYIRRVLQKERFQALLKAAVGTLAINAWYLIPFFDYMTKESLKVNTEVVAGTFIQKNGLSLGQVLKILPHGTGTNIITGGQEGMPLGIGLGLQFVLILACYVLVKYRKEKEMRGLLFLAIGMGFFALLGASIYFPWDMLVRCGMGILSSIQFPWRFLGSAVVLFCTGAGGVFWILERNVKPVVVNTCMGIILLASVLSSGYMMVTFMETAKAENCYEQREATYYVSGGEYLPADIVFSEDAFHPLAPTGIDVQIGMYEKLYNKVTVACKNELDEENVVCVPILLYRGYRAFDVATKENFPMLRMENGMTGIMLPPGYQGTVCMRFQEPFFWRISEMVSAFTLLMIFLSHPVAQFCPTAAFFR